MLKTDNKKFMYTGGEHDQLRDVIVKKIIDNTRLGANN